MDDNSIKVLKALENPNYKWRTIIGLEKETKLTKDVIQDILKKLDDYVIRSSIPDKNGNILYTTRKHYHEKQNIFTRGLTAISGSIKH